jgi:hypothetical protein
MFFILTLFISLNIIFLPKYSVNFIEYIVINLLIPFINNHNNDQIIEIIHHRHTPNKRIRTEIIDITNQFLDNIKPGYNYLDSDSSNAESEENNIESEENKLESEINNVESEINNVEKINTDIILDDLTETESSNSINSETIVIENVN